MDSTMITTAFELPGYRIVRNLGIVRGITVRSRSIVFNFLGGLQSLFGGNITIYTELCESARSETFHLMRQHAQVLRANAVSLLAGAKCARTCWRIFELRLTSSGRPPSS